MIHKKYKDTTNEHFGVDHWSKLDSSKQRMSEVNGSKSVQDKTMNTN